VSDLDPAKLLEGIRQREHKVLSRIYVKYYPVVLRYILNNSGSESDAKDVFQESIIVLYTLASDKNFEIREQFAAFITGIAKRIWLKQIRHNAVKERYVEESKNVGEQIEEHPSDEELENELELALIRKHIVNLGEECRKVLMMAAEGLKNEEIAQKQGYKSESVVRVKKSKCKNALINMIKKDPNFKEGGV
jgi:RNA polymerase sigma factor (sigma-70 family)